MANTYTQIHIQAVFAVQNRESLIASSWRDRLYQYIVSLIEKHGHKVLCIGGVRDHVHVLFGQRPTQSLDSLMREVKRGSSLWINQNNFVVGKFRWQEGYGGFSYGKSQLDAVVKYINNQEAHHKKQTLREEHIKMLQKFGVEYNEQYIFRDVVV